VLLLVLAIGNGQQSNKREEVTLIDPYAKTISVAVEYASKNQYNHALEIISSILRESPLHFDANQLYASVLLGQDKFIEAVQYFERSFSILSPNELAMYRNYIESLRLAGMVELACANAARLLATFGDSLSRSDSHFFVAYARAEQDASNFIYAIQLAEKAVNLDPMNLSAWNLLIDLQLTSRNYFEAEKLARQFLEHFNPHIDILSRLGISLQYQRRLEDALHAYLEAERISPTSPYILSCLAAVYQELGLSTDSYFYFHKAIPLLPHDAAVRNNFGALLGSMGYQREELYWLNEALKLQPNMSQAIVNLAGHYQDEGDISLAIHYLNEIPDYLDEKKNMVIRIATMLSPIPSSWDEMARERLTMKHKLEMILSQPRIVFPCDSTIDRLHFYLSFHGMNDLPMQLLVGNVYKYRLNEVGIYSPLLQTTNPVAQRLSLETRSMREIALATHSTSILPYFASKIRVGFISKFFGIFEPHGMLLDGIMQYLPRSHFYVVCFFVARTDFKVVAPRIMEACDETHELSLTIRHVLDYIKTIPLDALLFADVLSEPINHFLTHSRFAPIQIAFWGNPITTGSSTIDYYLTADVMEHPYRTRIASGQDAYSEQVWMMEGQGIWYFRPIDPNIEIEKAKMSHLVSKVVNYTRQDFNLPVFDSGVFLYLLPQSTFKIHPLYDFVLREILAGNSKIHIAVTGGRRPSWTARYLHRLRYNLGAEYSSRLHLIERVSSQNFYSLLALADGVLHPFPFDGSRTSADALQVHIPYVTLPTEYLRGRMGLAFYRTMNVSELVAVDVQDYIDIALRLAEDKRFFHDMKARIVERVDLIWEDMTVPFHATQFLQRIFGLPVTGTLKAYLDQITDRYGPGLETVSEDMNKAELRGTLQAAFDEVFSRRQQQRRHYLAGLLMKSSTNFNQLDGCWELDAETRVAILEGFMNLDEQGNAEAWPRLFQHWRHVREAEHRPLKLPSGKGMPPLPYSNDSTPFDPFPLHVTRGERPNSAVSRDGELQKGAPRQEVRRTSEHKEHVPLDVQVLQTDSSDTAASPLPLTSAVISIDVKADASVQRVSSSFATINSLQTNRSLLDKFYAYDLHGDHDSMRTVIDQLQIFRRLLRRGRYEESRQILLQLEESGYALPTHNAIFQLEKGIAHLHLGDIGSALKHCRLAHALNASLVNALGCVGVALTYSSDRADKEEASRVFLQALQLHERFLLAALDEVRRLHPHESDDRQLVDLIDNDILAASGPSVVSMPLDSLLFSYIASLVNLEEFDVCVDTYVDFFGLPPIAQGGSHIVIMAQLSWSDLGLQVIEEMFSKKIAIIPHIHYLQEHALLLLSNMGLCLSVSPTYGHLYKQAFQDVTMVIERIHRQHNLLALRKEEFVAASVISSPVQTVAPGAVTIVTQYFRAASVEEQRVLDLVLYRNLMNPAIDEVHLLTEEDFLHDLQAKFPQSLSRKLHQRIIGKRLTFAAAFQYANDFLTDRLVALVNADIYFDESLFRLLYATKHYNLSASTFATDRILVRKPESDAFSSATSQSWRRRSFPPDTVLSLLRWQHHVEGEITLSLRIDSQDAWIFRPPLHDDVIAASHFPLGVPRCDNRLAYVFQALNYTVRNPAMDIHAIEYQTPTSAFRTGLYGMKDSVPGDVRMLLVNDVLSL
jgi:predicted O-linked N-acetylglucosamine transferase (SPINDLY family)